MNPEVADGAPMIYVVDDDVSVRDALGNLFASVGLGASLFDSTGAFLRATRADGPSCLVLDVRLPGVGGLEFQEHLGGLGIRIPIVFITAHGDVPMTARAMKAGAVEFLTKPFQKDELLAAVHHAVGRDRAVRAEENVLATLQARFDTLTVREREVLQQVTAGLSNKQIAAQLRVAEITIKVHRRQAMRKMLAGSLAELVRMTAKLEPRLQASGSERSAAYAAQ
jgi:FixJ family two-component response regulator